MIYQDLDWRLKQKQLSDLIDLPLIVTVNDFTPSAAKTFREEMIKAINTRQQVIPVVIDSYGGQVYALLSMLDTIKSVPSDVKVATISTGKSMSCGAVLFSAGTEGCRYITKYSTLMIHEVALGSQGKVEEVKADASQGEKLNDLLFHIMAENVGKPKDYFLDLVHEHNHADWYLDANECRKHNLANHIGMPSFNVSVSVDIDFS
jgi:ATP-dependent Clp protease protease subunit